MTPAFKKHAMSIGVDKIFEKPMQIEELRLLLMEI